MDSKKLEELSEKYKKQLQNLDTQGLKMLADDHTRALEYAKNGIEMVEPENLTDEYVETVANTMQSVAKMILEERGGV